MAGAGKGSVLWSQGLHLQATAPGEKRKWHNHRLGLGCAYGQPGTHNVDCLLGGLAQAQGVGRARDVVRGQDGHDDGNNMMRAPNRRLSAPVSEGLKEEGGCAWPRPPALNSPGQKLP